MQSKNRVKFLELILVIGVLAFVYLTNLSQVEFHSDESMWIGTSYIFENYVRLEFKSEVWDKYYKTVTNPPVANYVIGLGRFIGGFRRPDLNKPWNYERGREYNERIGAMPSENLLWWSRLPMAIMAVLSVGIGFLLLRKLSVITGYLWLALILFNPYFSLHLRRAMGESTLVFLSMLTLLFDIQALAAAQTDNAHQKRNSLLWLFLAGITSGLAGEAKLNGIPLLGANVVVAILLGSLLNRPLKEKIIATVQYGLVTSFAGIFAFIGSNPYLWPAPLTRSIQMFVDRAQTMQQQAITYSGSFMTPAQRLTIIPTRIFHDYASLPIPAVFNFALVTLGVVIALLSIRGLRARKNFDPTPIVMLVTAFFVSAPIWLNQLDWDRYYMYPELFAVAFTALALDWIIRTGWRYGKKFFSPQTG
jgi:hypothetical protein